MVTPALATEVSTSGNTGTVPVQVTAEAARFSVTIPTALPVNVDSAGVVTVATEASIQNNSVAPIRVMGVSLAGDNGWSIEPYDKDYSTSEMDLKEAGFTLNGDASTASGDLGINPDNWPSIGASQSQGITYSANIAPQSSALTQQIASVVFTVGWDMLLAPISGEVDKGRLRQAMQNITSSVYFNNTTLDTTTVPDGSVVTDVSAAQDGSVMAVAYGTEHLGVHGAALSAPVDSSGMFQDLNVSSLSVRNLDTSRVRDMSNMFNGLTARTLTGLDTLNTANVTNMSMIFAHTPNIKEFTAVQGWNTANVTDMSGAFALAGAGYKRLSLDLSAWDVSKVQNMSSMFNGFKVEELVLSGWKTSSLIRVAGMFQNSDIAAIPLNRLDFSKVQSAACLCDTTTAQSIGMPTGGMLNVTEAEYMFCRASNVSYLDLRGLPLSTFSSETFKDGLKGCSSLTSIRVNSQSDADWLMVSGALPDGFDTANIEVVPKF